jgi:hypothetical protein
LLVIIFPCLGETRRAQVFNLLKHMDTYTSSISPSINNNDIIITELQLPIMMPQSESNVVNSIENDSGLQKVDKRKSLPQLYKKGQSGNPSGRPKGSINIKAVLDKRLKKRNAIKMIDTMIAGAENGEDKKTEMILKLKGELNDKPIVNIQQNSFSVSPELIELAKQFLLQRNNKNDAVIIDVAPIKMIENNDVYNSTGSI